MNIGNREAISINEACERAHVSRRTLYNWIASDRVEYCRTVGGSIRVFVDTLWREDTQRDADKAEILRKNRAAKDGEGANFS